MFHIYSYLINFYNDTFMLTPQISDLRASAVQEGGAWNSQSAFSPGFSVSPNLNWLLVETCLFVTLAAEDLFWSKKKLKQKIKTRTFHQYSDLDFFLKETTSKLWIQFDFCFTHWKSKNNFQFDSCFTLPQFKLMGSALGINRPRHMLDVPS